MVYMMFYYGILFLILGIAVFLFIMAGSRKIRNKNLSFVMIGLGINILTSPVALFIGGMATDSPYSTVFDFWKGFLFIQGIPLFLLLIAFIWWFIRPPKVNIQTSIEKGLEQNMKSTKKKNDTRTYNYCPTYFNSNYFSSRLFFLHFVFIRRYT
ncbi:hypothetical protein DJ43_2651 [Bacillus anthracis]|nr:hypothetical protein BF89_4685 [Bacillus anthracis]KFL68869.1 hypothetical protein DJ43_2651 [Bacillus anthracis]BBK96259.1 hypothetical protein BAPCR_02275 [Bacillus anthracis]